MADAPDDGLATILTTGPLSRRTALGRLGRGGVAASALAAMAAAPRAAAQEVEVEASASGPGGAGGDTEPREPIVAGTTRDGLPEVSAETSGRLRRLTDDDRGLWLETDEQWVSLGGEVFDVRAYGAVGDGTTDDWGAFEAAVEAMTSRLEVDSTSAYGRTLLVPPGTYRLAQTLVLDKSVRLVGTGATGHTSDSILLVDEGVVGILVADAEPGLTGTSGRRGDGAIVERLRIVSAPAPTKAADDGEVPTSKGSTAAADPATVHGIWLRASASVRDVCVEGFSGDGIHVAIDLGPGGEGGAVAALSGAAWQVAGSWVAGCGGSGLTVEGAGVGLAELVTVAGNGGWGIRDAGAGTTYVRCRAAGNASGAFTATGSQNRSVVVGCTAAADQPRSVFADGVLVVGGAYADGYQGGNAWTADASRVQLRAQSPGGGEDRLPTVPTLHLRGAAGQTEPHLRVGDRAGGQLVAIDAAGRLLVGPAGLTPPAASGDAAGSQPVQVQISHAESGQAAIRWVVSGEAAAWVAQARAYREAGGTDANPTGGGSRLTFQTAGATGQELDTLTLREGRVGIGTVTPSPAAVLDLASAGQGFLPPRMTGEQRDAIAGVPEGLTIFNTTSKRLNVHDGERWREVAFTEPVVGG